MTFPLLDYHYSDCNVNTSVIHASDEIRHMEEIPGRLRRLRTALGLTQAALARAAGVSQGTIGNIESGLRGYGESLVDIAKSLGVSTAYLRCEPNAPFSDEAIADDEALFTPTGVTGKAAPTHIDVAALFALGRAIEQASPADRISAIALLTTFIEDPKSNMDLMPLIAKRLSGEIEPERLTAAGGSK